MATGLTNPSGTQQESDMTPEQRRNRATIALIVLTALAVLLAWWVWANTGVVPDVTGMSEPEARAALEAAGFKVGEVKVDKTALEDPGMVDDQGIVAGTRALKGDTIDLFIAGGGDDDPFEPDISDVSTGAAGGFAIEEEDPDSIRDRGDDEYSSPLGKKRYPGVPQVLNQTLSSAVAELEAAGYSVRVVRATNAGGIAKGRIFYQTPEPGAAVGSGTVEIWVSTGAPSGGPRLRPNIPPERS